MPDHTTNPSTAAQTILADRACTGCGFNLLGQIVTKEEHYNLAIAKCPECGTVAALQSYPTMSHWVNRFRALIAAVWMLALLFAFMIQVAIIVSYSNQLSGDIGVPLAKELGSAFNDWQVANGEASVTENWGANLVYFQWVNMSESWVDEHLKATIEDNGGLIKLIDPSSILLLISGTIGAFVFGVFWSVTLLGASRKKAAIVPVIIGVIAIWVVYGFSTFGYASWQSAQVAQRAYEPWVVLWVVIFELPVLLVGLYFGRKIVRAVITLALPARSRVPFSILWTRDGLELPKP